MKALVYHGPHQMRWEDWREQPPGADECVVRVRAVGICGSDLHGYTGESGRRTPPMVMGHEATGEVTAVRAGVSQDWLGRSVIIQPFVACGTCDFCLAGETNRCRNRRFYGGNMSGAMAEKITVSVSNLIPLADTLSYAAGTLTEPLAVALHAVRQAGDVAGKSVLIAGCGPIGLLTLIAAGRAGAARVIMTDLIPARMAAARQLGADWVLNPTTEDWREPLSAAGVGEVDIAFDAVGVAATFQQALDTVRPGGRVIAIGGWRAVTLNLAQVVTREIQIYGTFNFTPAEFVEASQLLAEPAFDPLSLITDTYPLADGAAVFAELAANQAGSIKVILTSLEDSE
ncbi:MAG: alcohol dehydrogenase catalytic domain-containing protein [Anaerolineae bacterium]|nr:alcohol dehydrogenase catalytic domain-containing protein [Anaerolineae bacterium]